MTNIEQYEYTNYVKALETENEELIQLVGKLKQSMQKLTAQVNQIDELCKYNNRGVNG